MMGPKIVNSNPDGQSGRSDLLLSKSALQQARPHVLPVASCVHLSRLGGQCEVTDAILLQRRTASHGNSCLLDFLC